MTILLALCLLAGCASILETERLTITPHVPAVTPPPDDEVRTAADYARLRAAVRETIARRLGSVEIRVYEYDGDLEWDIEALRADMMYRDALGAYAVEDITLTMVQIVSYMQIDVLITYRNHMSRSQIDAVIPVDDEDTLREVLMRALTEYDAQTVLLTERPEFTARFVLDLIEELYYSNPLLIVMLPAVEAAVFPPEPDGELLIDLSFAYSTPAAVLRAFGGVLESAVRDIAERAAVDDTTAALRALVLAIAEYATYDVAAASMPEYSTLNDAATAYGALLGGNAISEGYAMALKALCDALEIECAVVRGTRDGRQYAWNTVVIDGAAYHIDAAMCDVEGFGGYFMRTDDEMSSMGYIWAVG